VFVVAAVNCGRLQITYNHNVGFEVLTAVVMKSTILWGIMPCSLLKVNRLFGGTYRLHPQGRISRAKYQREGRWQVVFCSAYLTLRMKAICSSEMSIDFHQTTWCYIPEDSILNNNSV
jgi:hypothetical protein